MGVTEYADVSTSCEIKDPRPRRPSLKVFEVVFIIMMYSGYSLAHLAKFLAHYYGPKYKDYDAGKVREIYDDCCEASCRDSGSLRDWVGLGSGQPDVEEVVAQFKEKFGQIS